MRTLSTNPSSIRTRASYQRHKYDPGFLEGKLARKRELRKTDRKFREDQDRSVLKYRLKVRDTEEYHKKKNAYSLRYRAANPESNRVAQKKWAGQNREKTRAHMTVHKAVVTGKIQRPTACSVCGIVPPPRRDGCTQIHAHHRDYSKPLDVQWLCALCHAIERRKYK
jgi:hypothetical protein